MPKAQLYNNQGDAKGKINLNPEIFDIKFNQTLIHQILVSMLANKRINLADTKDRGEVRGGGKKPWKQKGTGRARHGSIRSPLWKGGGVTFGPTTEVNFTQKVNKKMKTKALFMVLSAFAEQNGINIIESIDLHKVKTKNLLELMNKISDYNRKVIVLEKMDKQVALSARNIKGTVVLAANSLNIYDLLNTDSIIFVESALKKIEEIYI